MKKAEETTEKPKRPVGRPRTFVERLGSNLTGVRITIPQLDQLRRQAAEADRSLTSYVRNRLGLED